MPKTSIKTALVTAAHNSVGLGITGNGILPMSPWWDGVSFGKADLWSRENIATAVVPGTKVAFFTRPKAARVTNVSGPTIVPGESAFWLQHLRFQVNQAHQTDGTAVSQGEPAQTGASAGNSGLVLGDILTLLEHSIVRLKVGKVERTFAGMSSFPWGGGGFFNGALSNTTATTIVQAFRANNGNPDSANKYAFTPPIAIYPDDAVELDVELTCTRTLTTIMSITASLEGILTETT